MDLNVFLSPWTLFFAALIVVIVLLIVLTLFERRLKKRVTLKKEEQSIFHKKLASLDYPNQTPREFLIAIDALARDFLSQHHAIDRNAKYSELAHTFKKEGNIHVAQFCSKMQEVLYSGEEVSKEKLTALAKNLEFIINVETQTAKKEKTQAQKPHFSFFNKQKTPELDKRIVGYLVEGLKRGFSLDLLRKKLLDAGFTKQEIELAENHLNLNIKKAAEEHLVLDKPTIMQQQIEAKEEPKQELRPLEEKDHIFIKSLDNLDRIKGRILERTKSSGAKEISDKTGLV
jgi:hypothetical protein